jgi:hypothetical protein
VDAPYVNRHAYVPPICLFIVLHHTIPTIHHHGQNISHDSPHNYIFHVATLLAHFICQHKQMFAQNPFGDAVMVGGAITAADPDVSITARYKKPAFGTTIPNGLTGYNALKRDIVGRFGGDKWKDLDRKAKKLHRKLDAIDSRYNMQSNTTGGKQNALSAWRKAVSTADPEVRDVVSVLYDDLEAQWQITHGMVGDSAEPTSRASVKPDAPTVCSRGERLRNT